MKNHFEKTKEICSLKMTSLDFFAVTFFLLFVAFGCLIWESVCHLLVYNCTLFDDEDEDFDNNNNMNRPGSLVIDV